MNVLENQQYLLKMVAIIDLTRCGLMIRVTRLMLKLSYHCKLKWCKSVQFPEVCITSAGQTLITANITKVDLWKFLSSYS